MVSYQKYVKAAKGLSFIAKVFQEKAGWCDPFTLGKGPSPWSYLFEILSRTGRVIPLSIAAHLRQSCALWRMRVVPRRNVLRPEWDEGIFFCN